MRRLARKGLIIFVIIEITIRLVVDPLYFYSIDSYTPDKTGYSFKRLYFPKKIENIDYLFVGESRIASAINIEEISKISDTIIAINAGRGYTTGAIHYWALKKLLRDNPNVLKKSKVIIETAGGINFTENFEKGKFIINEDYLQFILPYLNFRLLKDFLMYSDCKSGKKIKLVLLYSSSLYRTVPFLRNKLHELVNRRYNTNQLAPVGGIRTDQDFYKEARLLLIKTSKENIEKQDHLIPFTSSDLDKSILSKIDELIISSGGQLFLLEMPLHSIQKAVYQTNLNIRNKETFRNWAKEKNIKIIEVDDFIYSDNDFPDYWHLGRNRNAEFTNKFFNKMKTMN